jgi:hypothetical protein
LGRQASAKPCGAQQLPLTLPCAALKLQGWPLARDLQAASASAGGGGGPLPAAGCADAALARIVETTQAAPTSASAVENDDRGRVLWNSLITMTP